MNTKQSADDDAAAADDDAAVAADDATTRNDAATGLSHGCQLVSLLDSFLTQKHLVSILLNPPHML